MVGERSPGAAVVGAGGRAVGAVAAVLVASAVLSAGVGVGLRHLWAGDRRWTMVLGFVALAVGLASVVAAVRLGTRSLAGARRVAAATVLTLLAVVSVWTLAPAFMATVVPATSHGPARPAGAMAGAGEVTITADDGVALWAWYLPPRNGRAVVLRHGAGSTAAAVLPQAEVLAAQGYGVLAMDARGHGHSGGRAMDFGWYGERDVAAGVSFLAARPEVTDGVAVLGESMGGEEAIGALGTDRRIVAAVAEGATARTDEDKAWYADVYGVRGRIQLGLEWVQYGLVGLLTPASEPQPLARSAAAAAPRPLLLITAGTVAEEGHAADHIRAASPATVTVWTVPGAGHTDGLARDPEGWERTVVAFLDGAFASTPPG